MITSSATQIPYYHTPASPFVPHRVEEPPVHDLPWITKAVKSQVTVPYDTFFKSFLPEHHVASMDCDVHVEEVIREYSSPDLKKTFTRLFNTLTGSLERRHVDGSLPSGSTVSDLRVPDCALVEIDLEGKNTGLNGAYYSKEGRYKSVWHLLAKRASDALSTGIPRNHIYGVYVKQEHAYFIYYDHSVVIVSEPLNWVKEASHLFWKAIYVVSRLPLDRIGCTAVKCIDFPGLGLSINGLNFEFMDVVHTSECILGEGTSIIHARVLSEGPWKNEVVTIRFGFIPVEKGWKDEETVITDIRKKLPKIAACLPYVLTSKAFSSSPIEGEVSKVLGKAYQTRALRVTVYAGQLYPVASLMNDVEMLRVLRDVMIVRECIRVQLNVYHRALNPGNILYSRVGEKVRGILIGYELSACCTEITAGTAPSLLQSVEALPFVSPDILNNYTGGLIDADYDRYDLESVYYVLFFIASHYDNGKHISRIKAPFNIWFGDNHVLSASTKMENIFNPTPRFMLTQTLAKLENKVRNLHDALRCGYNRRKRTGDSDSIYMHINFDQFCAELFFEVRREDLIESLRELEREEEEVRKNNAR